MLIHLQFGPSVPLVASFASLMVILELPAYIEVLIKDSIVIFIVRLIYVFADLIRIQFL